MLYVVLVQKLSLHVDESSESLQLCRTMVVMVAVVVVVDSLELELDEEYPDEDGDLEILHVEECSCERNPIT